MQDDRITIQLRLPELMVLAVKETEHVIEVAAQFRSPTGQCPRCGQASSRIHQSHLQRKRDVTVFGKELWLAVFKRRFRCQRCGKVFTEEDPVCGRRRRTTARFPASAGSRGWLNTRQCGPCRGWRA